MRGELKKMGNEIEVIVLGKVLHKKYQAVQFLGMSTRQAWATYDVLEEKELWKGNLSNPIIDVGDILYIKELDLEVKLIKRTRTTDSKIIYMSDYKFEIIEDEETVQSKIQAEKEAKEYNQNHQVQYDKIPEKDNSSWWRRLFK